MVSDALAMTDCPGPTPSGSGEAAHRDPTPNQQGHTCNLDQPVRMPHLHLATVIGPGIDKPSQSDSFPVIYYLAVSREALSLSLSLEGEKLERCKLNVVCGPAFLSSPITSRKQACSRRK